MAGRRTIGREELPVFHYVAEHQPVTVRSAARHFAATAGLARTTILTVMDRLRRKGFLTRRKVGGVYQYSPRVPQETLLQTLVRDFVEGTLGGSLAPFVAYLTREAALTEDQLADLRRLVQDLDAQPQGERP
jgi:predicted transcriptional regulator